MSISDDRSRNRSGLQFLRSRYQRRAAYLIESRSSGYLEAIRGARRSWSAEHPRWTIRVSTIPSDLKVSMDLGKESMFWPPQLYEHWLDIVRRKYSNDLKNFRAITDAHWEWQDLIHSLVNRFWPERYFPNPFTSGHIHGASGVVSASLLYLSDTTVIPHHRVDQLIPPFLVAPRAVPYSPHESVPPDQVARDQGMSSTTRTLSTSS